MVKEKDKKMLKIFGISTGIVAFLAFMDLKGLEMFNVVGGFAGDTYSKLEPSYMGFFWTFALGIILFSSITYLVTKKDKSEAFALFVIPMTLLWAGLEDVFYYIFGGFSLSGTTMPWLNNNLFISTVTKAMGLDVVSTQSLFVSVGIGIILSIGIYKLLERY